ncbi:hypothetical protein EMIT0P74_20346 [Pseudomonas sp. IT-P74]
MRDLQPFVVVLELLGRYRVIHHAISTSYGSNHAF